MATQKITEAEKNDEKNGTALYNLINKPVYGKSMETWNSDVIRLVNNKKTLLEMDIKTKLHSTKNIGQQFDSYTQNLNYLTLNKPVMLACVY